MPFGQSPLHSHCEETDIHILVNGIKTTKERKKRFSLTLELLNELFKHGSDYLSLNESRSGSNSNTIFDFLHKWVSLDNLISLI